MSKIALKLIREAKETRATRLDLGNCGLTELPEALFELTWLEELNLSNEWYEDQVYFKKSPNNGVQNHIKSLSPSLHKLKNLTHFRANGSSEKRWFLNDISPISKLKKLEYLHLARTSVEDLTPLSDLGNLGYLNMSYSFVKDISPLKDLYLQYLDLEYTEVADLTPLASQNGLQALFISNTNVESLFPLWSLIENGMEVKLKRFDSNGIMAQDCRLINPPIEIAKQGNNAIIRYFKNINKSFTIELIDGKLIYLDQKNISAIDKILDAVESSTDFKNEFIIIKNGDDNEFKLFFSHIVRIIKNRKIQTDKQKLTKAELDKNKKALVKLSTELSKKIFVETFLIEYRKDKSTVDLYEAKLIIVGEGNTGKTTLFEKLKDNNYKLQPVDETHGINIHEGLEFTHPLIGENVFNANLWDFGGQELQYMTHQFFLTPRGLYVLMMDARKESPNLAYWFKIISLLGRDSQDSTEKVKLLLVFNKRGNTTGTPQYQDQLKYYEDTLDVQYLEVDFAENDYRFEALQKAIQQSLVTLPIVKSQLPRLWKVVREDLREEAKNNQYITTQRYSDMCSKHGITEEADQWLLSGYLHQLGSLLHFQNDKGLMHFVILSPQWATDGVYTFLSAESIKENNGRFTDIAFNQLLAAKGYKRADANLVLQLMTKNNFDICYEATEGNYVAAQLLPENRPDAFLWKKTSGALQFRYQYPIMPKGLMSRLIVRLSEYIELIDNQEVVWKKGVILRIPTDKNNADNYSRVLMYEDDAESKSGLRQIIIEVMGNPQGHRKHALQRVREEVESLHKKWFRSIKPDEMVPCCCSECVKNDNPQLFKLTNLLTRRLKRNDTSCDVSGEDLLIQSLLDGVYDKGEIREMENMGRY